MRRGVRVRGRKQDQGLGVKTRARTYKMVLEDDRELRAFLEDVNTDYISYYADSSVGSVVRHFIFWIRPSTVDVFSFSFLLCCRYYGEQRFIYYILLYNPSCIWTYHNNNTQINLGLKPSIKGKASSLDIAPLTILDSGALQPLKRQLTGIDCSTAAQASGCP